MTKDTKEIIIRTLLNIASESQKVSIEEISKRSHITRTTIKNNFKTGIPGIVEYIYLNIVDEVNERLLQYNCITVKMLLLNSLLTFYFRSFGNIKKKLILFLALNFLSG